MRIALLVLVALLAGCQASLPALPDWQSHEGLQHPDLGRIVELSSGKTLTPEQLVARLVDAPKVLVGERHDNPDHHAQQRPQGSLLLEMLNPNQQAKVDQVRQALQAGQTPPDILTVLAWQPGWSWSLYGPLVQHALRQPCPLLAANLDRSEVMQIYSQVPTLSGQASSAPAVRETLLAQIRESHCNLLPESQLPAMLAVQQQRDRRMTEALLAAPQPSLLIAGSFHVRRDLGVPLHLQDLQGADGTPVLILAEIGTQITSAAADFVWYTPAQPQQDHCATLRR